MGGNWTALGCPVSSFAGGNECSTCEDGFEPAGGSVTEWNPWHLLPPLEGDGFSCAMLQVCCVYYLGAITVHALIPRLLTSTVTPVNSHKTLPRRQQREQVVRESLLSFGPLAVRAFIYWLVELAHQRNWGMLYEGDVVVFTQSFPAQAAAIGASVLLLDFLHDAWFFFMHLLMHRNRWLLVHVHYLHHDSKVPTPFSGYSLHVLEAMLVFPIDLMVCFLIPIHVKVHRLYHLFTIFLHVGGHATYELHPLVPSLGQLLWIFFQGDRVSDELNTVLYHNLHHQFPNCHFSLYFTHWDRWFNTLKKDYRARVDKMKEIQKGQIERETTYLKYYLVLLMCMTCAVALSCLAYTLIYNAARLACNLLANVR